LLHSCCHYQWLLPLLLPLFFLPVQPELVIRGKKKKKKANKTTQKPFMVPNIAAPDRLYRTLSPGWLKTWAEQPDCIAMKGYIAWMWHENKGLYLHQSQHSFHFHH
jgi:hypothetical protein